MSDSWVVPKIKEDVLDCASTGKNPAATNLGHSPTEEVSLSGAKMPSVGGDRSTGMLPKVKVGRYLGQARRSTRRRKGTDDLRATDIDFRGLKLENAGADARN